MMISKRVPGLIVLGAICVGTTLAGDDSPPLFVIEDGKRVPGRILPDVLAAKAPQTPAQAANRLAVAQPDQSPMNAKRSASVEGEEERTGAAKPTNDAANATAQLVNACGAGCGTFGGYPVSFVDRGFRGQFSACWPYRSPQELYDYYLVQRRIDKREQARRFNRDDMQERKQRILRNHGRAIQAGLTSLGKGAYAEAVVSLSLAAEMNNGDPACRVHLAQARLALGQYSEAAEAIRRALELQPKLAYIQLDLPTYYSDPGAFDEHVDQLAAWLRRHAAPSDVYFLWGFLEFQRGDFDLAAAAFRRVARVKPDDDLTQAYLKITRPDRSDR